MLKCHVFCVNLANCITISNLNYPMSKKEKTPKNKVSKEKEAKVKEPKTKKSKELNAETEHKSEKMPKGRELLLSAEDLLMLNSKDGILELLRNQKYDIEKALDNLRYEEELAELQAEMAKLQQWIIDNNQKLLIIIEGRDAAGKGGLIQRFTRNLMPRNHRIVALPKPTPEQMGQWYFQRYIQHLPTQGEIVFFDRSWYNRAVVEPVNGFCTDEQYERFMEQVNQFEKMLIDSGLLLIKFQLEVSKKEQAKRLKERYSNPLKQWKLGPVDAKAQELWDKYSLYIDAKLQRTHSSHAPWVVIQADDKKSTRLEALRYVLNVIPYCDKSEVKNIDLEPNKSIVRLADEWQ